MKLGTLDLLEEHCRNERQPLLRCDRKIGHEIGLGGKKMDGWTRRLPA
jgi:hypothetical protein